MENKVEYYIGIGMNMLLPVNHVFYLEEEDSDDTIKDLEPQVMPTLELEDA